MYILDFLLLQIKGFPTFWLYLKFTLCKILFYLGIDSDRFRYVQMEVKDASCQVDKIVYLYCVCNDENFVKSCLSKRQLSSGI
jgi:hypothetical protein